MLTLVDVHYLSLTMMYTPTPNSPKWVRDGNFLNRICEAAHPLAAEGIAAAAKCLGFEVTMEIAG